MGGDGGGIAGMRSNRRQSLPPHPSGDDDPYLYGGLHDNLVLTDDYRAMSAQAGYAEQQQQQQTFTAAPIKPSQLSHLPHSQMMMQQHHHSQQSAKIIKPKYCHHIQRLLPPARFS
uniref:Uncharacterized protein n=1 Tax=Anopheles melas TaxID=34690 RepID=A0A182UEE5_9DIPT